MNFILGLLAGYILFVFIKKQQEYHENNPIQKAADEQPIDYTDRLVNRLEADGWIHKDSKDGQHGNN